MSEQLFMSYTERLLAIEEEYQRRRERLYQEFDYLETWKERAIRRLREAGGELDRPGVVDGTAKQRGQ